MGQTGLENDNFFDGIFLVRTFLKTPKLTPNHFGGAKRSPKNVKLAILNITEILAGNLKSFHEVPHSTFLWPPRALDQWCQPSSFHEKYHLTV